MNEGSRSQAQVASDQMSSVCVLADVSQLSLVVAAVDARVVIIDYTQLYQAPGWLSFVCVSVLVPIENYVKKLSLSQ